MDLGLRMVVLYKKKPCNFLLRVGMQSMVLHEEMPQDLLLAVLLTGAHPEC